MNQNLCSKNSLRFHSGPQFPWKTKLFLKINEKLYKNYIFQEQRKTRQQANFLPVIAFYKDLTGTFDGLDTISSKEPLKLKL